MSSFCTAKATHIFSAKNFCISLDVNFNESLTNDIVSFEQLGQDHITIVAMYLSYTSKLNRAGTWHLYNVSSMWMHRLDIASKLLQLCLNFDRCQCNVASTLMWHCLNVACLLGILKMHFSTATDNILDVFPRNYGLIFHVKCKLWRGFTWNIKPHFLG